MPMLVPLRDHRYDLDALLDAVTAAHEDRLRLPPEQPDRDDEHARRARRLLRARARARAHRGRPGVLRVRRRIPTIRTPSRSTSKRGERRRRPAHVLEDLRARRAARRLRGRPARDVRGDGEGAAAVRREHDRAGRGAREPRRRGRDRPPPRAQRGGPRAARGHARASTASSPPRGAVGNFLYVDVGEDAAPLYERLLREGVIVRPLHGFGAPTAIRVSVGTPEENDVFAAALGRVLATRLSPSERRPSSSARRARARAAPPAGRPTRREPPATRRSA